MKTFMADRSAFYESSLSELFQHLFHKVLHTFGFKYVKLLVTAAKSKLRTLCCHNICLGYHLVDGCQIKQDNVVYSVY